VNIEDQSELGLCSIADNSSLDGAADTVAQAIKLAPVINTVRDSNNIDSATSLYHSNSSRACRACPCYPYAMKFSVSKDKLLEGLSTVQNVVSTRTTLPILSNVLLQASDGQFG
jgi:hypothetical protein